MGAKWYPRGLIAPKARPWYERNNGARFKLDDSIVRACCPELEWRFDPGTRLARLEGAITLVEPCGVKTSVATRIEFSLAYPEREPVALETGHRFSWSQENHILPSNGICCLWLPPLSKWDHEDPEALRMFLDELVVFFDRQLVFEARGKWPGASWDHGVSGYWEFVIEELGSEAAADCFLLSRALTRNDFCPCKSGKKYKRCHLSQHEVLARRIAFSELTRLVGWRSRSWRSHSGQPDSANGIPLADKVNRVPGSES